MTKHDTLRLSFGTPWWMANTEEDKRKPRVANATEWASHTMLDLLTIA